MSDTGRLSLHTAFSVLICRMPGTIVVAVVVLFLLALTQIIDLRNGDIQLKVDMSEVHLLGADHEGWKFYQQTRKTFGNDETLLIAVQSDDVFSPRSVELIARLTHQLEAVQGVQKVISIANVLVVRNTDYGMDIAPAMEKMPNTPEEYDALRSDVMANPLISSALVSELGDTTAILVNLENTPGHEFLKQVNSAVDEIVSQDVTGAQVWVTGAPRIKLATTDLILSDLVYFPPLIALVMTVLLWILHRSLINALVPLATVIISVTWTVATISAMGYSLNLLTALVPPLLMILTLSYSMYAVSDFRQPMRMRQVNEREAAEILRKVALPVLLAGLTTAVGFSSLYLNELSAIREFGLFSVMGVVYATIVTLVFTPALIVLLQRWTRPVENSAQPINNAIFDRITQRVASFDATHRGKIFIVAALVFVIAVISMTQLRVGAEHISNFHEDS
ncbi:MAG: MMPL family transporter, partial [Gammaproteobacteria bacterium]|nr:MMPL family transporter [Gammaproteobacteria bacterium]